VRIGIDSTEDAAKAQTPPKAAKELQARTIHPRLAGVPFDDLVTGRLAVKGRCPHCGSRP